MPMAVFKNYKDDELIVSCKCGCDEGIYRNIAINGVKLPIITSYERTFTC